MNRSSRNALIATLLLLGAASGWLVHSYRSQHPPGQEAHPGDPTTATRQLLSDSASLTVNSVTSADAVNYRCVVTAGCGSVNSSEAALTLKATPSVTSQPVSAQVAPGGTTNFSVTATGDGTLTYQWKKNDGIC